MTVKQAGSSLRWCLRVKTGRPSSPSSTMALLPQRVREHPSLVLMLSALLSSSRIISGTSGMSSSPMSANSPMRVSMHCPSASLPSSPKVNSITPNTGNVKGKPCNTMRPGTGSGSKTSPISHTSPFSPTASCSSPGASSTKRQRRRD